MAANSAMRTKSGDSAWSGLNPTETSSSPGAITITRSLRCCWWVRSFSAIAPRRNGVASPCRSNHTKPRPALMSSLPMCRSSELLPLPVFPTTPRWVVRRVELIVTRVRETTSSTIASPSESLDTSRSPWRRSRTLFQILAKKWSNTFGMNEGWNYSEVRDDNFLEPLPGDFLRGVMKFDAVNLEGCKDRADLRHVVQTQHELALYSLQPFRHLHEIIVGQVEAIEGAVIVRRVQIEQCGRAVIPPEHVLIRQILDLNPCEALPRLLKEFGQAFGIEGGQLGNVRAVVAAAHEARIGVLGEVEVARG